MNRLHALAFALRGAYIRRQLGALQRRAGARPYAPSQHLVPSFPVHPVTGPEECQPGRLAPWFFVAALVLAFLAGCLAAADSRTATATTPALMCSITLHGNADSTTHNDQRGNP